MSFILFLDKYYILLIWIIIINLLLRGGKSDANQFYYLHEWELKYLIVHYFFYLKIEMHDSREIVKFLGINIT